MRLKEVIKQAQKKKTENSVGAKNVIGYWVWKSISYLITWPLVSTKVKPNQVTFVSLIAPILGVGLFFFAHTIPMKLLATLFFVVWAILDNVDGSLARITKRFSTNGDLWDAAAGYAALSLIFVGMGLAAYDSSSPISISNSVYYVALGGLGGVFSLYPRLLMHFKYHGEENDLNRQQGFGFLKLIAFNIITPDGLMIPAMIIAICLRLEWLFVVGYVFLYFLMAVYYSYLLLRD